MRSGSNGNPVAFLAKCRGMAYGAGKMKFLLAARPVLLTACVLAAVVLAGCAAKSDPAVDGSAEWRLRSLEESFLQFQEAQRSQEDRLKHLESRLEERLKRLETELEEVKAQQTASAGLAPAEPPVARSPEPRPWTQPPVSASSQTPSKSAAPALKSSSASKPAPVPARAPSAKEIQNAYERGLKLVLADKPGPGRDALKEFLARYPDNSLTPNALYWIGETWYAQKDYTQAVLSFKDVTQKYPRHPKASAALYKSALAYEATGDKANAVFYLKALLDEYPRSEEASPARVKLKALGG